VPLPGLEVTREELQARFEEAYWNRFEVALPEIRALLVTLHSAVIGKRKAVEPTALLDAGARRGGLGEAQIGERRVWFRDGWHQTPVLRREYLDLGAAFEGPAIIEQLDTTIVVEPDNRARVDESGNLLITVPPEGGAIP
ncbi:MAG: hydantoinase/oxoprolinase family protein, partial [Alphaproteobacteria bacterium]